VKPPPIVDSERLWRKLESLLDKHDRETKAPREMKREIVTLAREYWRAISREAKAS